VKKLVALAGLLVLGGLIGVAFAGQSEEPSSPAASPARITSNPYPYTNPIKRKGSSPARVAGDGRYFGYVRAADAESRRQTISFDVAQFFFGEDVQKAAEEDGAVAPGEAVSNDHYERNADVEPQTLTVARDARVTAAGVTRILTSRQSRARCRNGCDWVIPVSLDEFFAAVETERYGVTTAEAPIPVWVTVHDGRVVRIDEQYFP
jgi:hypothetical protein